MMLTRKQAKALKTIYTKGRYLMSEPHLSGARVIIGADSTIEAMQIQVALADLKPPERKSNSDLREYWRKKQKDWRARKKANAT